jgi:outer membrane protein assembly factor BamD (BamD/ComL family)
MGALTRAVEYGNEFMKKHPQHKEEVKDYFQLMKDEIEEGSSTEHEIDLFIGACDDLLIEE